MYQLLYASHLSTAPTRSPIRHAIFSQAGLPRLAEQSEFIFRVKEKSINLVKSMGRQSEKMIKKNTCKFIHFRNL